MEECEGEVVVTDPTHPLYGKRFKLVGVARLPGHVKHCQVELLPGQWGYIPVASTHLNTEPRPEPTVLTGDALQELVDMFQALPFVRRRQHATSKKSSRMGSSGAK